MFNASCLSCHVCVSCVSCLCVYHVLFPLYQVSNKFSKLFFFYIQRIISQKQGNYAICRSDTFLNRNMTFTNIITRATLTHNWIYETSMTLICRRNRDAVTQSIHRATQSTVKNQFAGPTRSIPAYWA